MRDPAAPVLTFEVPGLPPLRSPALSIFTAGSRQATRVRTLLTAACDAAQRTGWTPLTAPVALGVVVRRPPEQHLGEATNFLCGIGDVLQDKHRVPPGSVAHLGVLVDVALFVDDRQIQQINYREEPADEPSYQVKVAALD
ncbi:MULTISPECIES: hypothetical protein [unclassified Solwaraspora]|uniref:hypothetical protein n=1 Tax=unclassified Solwaraspora TaxID=2627926 RepID=UPI00259BCF97|nr:hypothetical protein [Solwaraspora sp. WMMA2056]WJK38487.1 hypothetical protein O7608_18475 [Solwaraspora sp. WMMA2056]